MGNVLKVIVIGCGNMGSSHARAYHALDGYELVGVVDRLPESREKLAAELGGVPQFDDLDVALATAKPDVAAICTYPDSHAALARKCLDAGTHLFVEKPVATTVEEASQIVEMVRKSGKKMVVGYILRVHPAWMKFIEIAQGLGKPLVMRMNLNQQSSGYMWQSHKGLMKSMSPIVDCGVHYVDVMCQMTRSKPTRIQAIAARLSDEIAEDMFNYGQLQVQFEDGSVGWYEAGWGPMMSEQAFFVKDVVGPKGCVSIVKAKDADEDTGSDDIDSHSKTNSLLVHSSELDAEGKFVKEDERIDTADEPDHQELCNREQAFLLNAIAEDVDLNDHWDDAINSLRIVLAADESARTGEVVKL